ncbi:hypothetical protein SORBI_3004G283050 [Sorghum bicolor]|uniref:Uncharacterized protein n=1 Tax=Sorghum bicolor TaxID=4558 RepID=A0A194YSB0_SORBI|nr:hypothetical protein SORBI_3004G283050 [Sorghum bicolor]
MCVVTKTQVAEVKGVRHGRTARCVRCKSEGERSWRHHSRLLHRPLAFSASAGLHQACIPFAPILVQLCSSDLEACVVNENRHCGPSLATVSANLDGSDTQGIKNRNEEK